MSPHIFSAPPSCPSPLPAPPNTESRPPQYPNTLAALVTVFQKDKVAISGPTKSYADTGSSGKTVHRVFCTECGSPIAHDPEAAPEIIAIKAGTLDWEQKKNLKPVRNFPLSISCPVSVFVPEKVVMFV